MLLCESNKRQLHVLGPASYRIFAEVESHHSTAHLLPENKSFFQVGEILAEKCAKV